MMARGGRSYVAYNRLKISSVTDDLVSMFARVFQIDEGSASYQGMRCLIRAWRDENYAQYSGQGKPTQNQFLLDFDVSYRLRRIRFVLNKLDELSRLDQPAREILRFRKQDAWLTGDAPAAAARNAEFRGELRALKEGLLGIYRRLHGLERRLWPTRTADSPLIALTQDLNITVEDLQSFTTLKPAEPAAAADGESSCKKPAGQPASEDECTARARRFLEERPPQKAALDAVAVKLRQLLRDWWLKPGHVEALDRLAESSTSAPVDAARNTIRHYYDCYEDYDQVLFPILFQSDIVGEGSAIEVIRLSPEDATCLMDDRVEAMKPAPLRKLAGITLGHFGAFVEREWRRNDIMWGRLDAAERLITTILPDAADEGRRVALIDEAQRAIIREELSDVERSRLFDQIAAAGASPASLAFARKILLDEKEALQDYREKLSREPDPKGAVRAIARSTQVIGKMLEGIAVKRKLETKRISLITRLGSIFWGLVEVAVPRSLPQLFFHYWLQLIYAFSILLIVTGILTGRPDATHAGGTVLAIAAAVHLATALLSDYMRGSRGVWKAAKVLVALIAGGCAVIGAVQAPRVFREAWDGIRGGTQTLPSHDLFEWVVIAIGAAGALAILTGLWMQSHARTLDFAAKRKRSSAGVRAPILAIEVPESSLDVRAVVGDLHGPDRETMREIQYGDFVFIAEYWLVFSGLAWLMQHDYPAWLPLAVAGFACATAGAVFDVLEDRAILKLLKQPLPAKPALGDALQALVNSTRRASLAKWGLLFTALLLLSPLFFALGGPVALLGICFTLAGLVGIIGLWKRPAIAIGNQLLGLGLLILTVYLLVKPERFLLAPK